VVRVLFYPEHFSPRTEATAKKSLKKARKFRGSAADTARRIAKTRGERIAETVPGLSERTLSDC
jgi:hypothetical protein